MEGGEVAASNGGLLYHEVQESKLCAVHCVNTVLQGPFFSEFDLAALASDLDQRERQMMMMVDSSGGGVGGGDFLSEDSHNVSLGGDFSIQVLEKALQVWDLQVIPLDSPAAEPSIYDPELENAFICHLHNHWFCIRKVNGEWYNFNSLYPAPEHLSKFYLSAYLDTLKGSGWSIFLVRGNFPKECPISLSDTFNGFGQWLTREDAERITKSCNQKEPQTSADFLALPSHSTDFISEEDALAEQEEKDLNDAIAASLMESSAFTSQSDEVEEKNISVDPINVPQEEKSSSVDPIEITREERSSSVDAIDLAEEAGPAVGDVRTPDPVRPGEHEEGKNL